MIIILDKNDNGKIEFNKAETIDGDGRNEGNPYSNNNWVKNLYKQYSIVIK